MFRWFIQYIVMVAHQFSHVKMSFYNNLASLEQNILFGLFKPV